MIPIRFQKLGFFIYLVFVSGAWSSDLGSAKITAIRNKVEKGELGQTRRAVVQDSLPDGQRLDTRQNSLAELKFNDQSLARLGANTTFSYNSESRLVQIDRGTALIHTPPGNGGLTITSGGVSGTVSGNTFLLTAFSEQGKATGGFALLVLEGRSMTRVTGPDGFVVEIRPGQMAVVGSGSKGAPRIFNVNLAQTIRTCPLIGAFPDPLPTLKEITQAAVQQQARGEIKGTGATGLAIASDSDILVGESKPPNPGKRVFEMAVNKPIPGGNKDDSAKDAGVEDIETAAGGDGGAGGGVPSGGGGGGGGAGGGSSVPSTPNPPVTPPPPPSPNPNPSPSTLPVAVINASASSKVYDGLLTATVGNALPFGIQVGDTVSLQNSTTGTFASKNVGTWSVSTSMGLVGTDASKYSLTQPTLNATITAKDVTMGAGSAAGKVYDGNTTAVVTAGSLSGLVGSEGLGTTVTGTFASKDVGTRNVAATYTLANGSNGGLASNYNLLNPTETLSAAITAKDVTIGSGSAASKVYDGNTTAVVTAGGLSGLVGSEGLGTTVTGTFASKDVGTRNVAVTYTLANGSNGGLASNYNLLNPTETLSAAITAKDVTMGAASAAGKVYDGNTTAVVTAGGLSGLVGSEGLGTTVTGTFASKDVGTRNVAATYTLANGSNGGLASNYNLLNPTETLTATITAKDVTMGAGSAAGKVYDGNTTAVVTAGSLSGLVGSEGLGTTVTGTFASKDVGTRNVAATYTLANGSNGGLASNYNLLNPTETLSAAITARALTVTTPTIGSKVYDGSATAGGVTVGTVGNLVGSETVTVNATAADYSSKNVGTYSTAVTYTLGNGANGGLANNYTLAGGTGNGGITAKQLDVNSAGITVSKAYDAGTGITAATDVNISSSALSGNSSGASDGKYIGTESVSLAVDTAGTFERSLPGTMIPVSTTVKMATGGDNGNYTLRAQPSGMTGEITGSATLNQNGAGLNVSSANYLHIRDTTASRVGQGLSIESTSGKVLLENCRFDGWMQRSSGSMILDSLGMGTMQFTEAAAVAVDKPVLGIKMSSLPGGDMFLGDYRVTISHYPDGTPGSVNDKTVDFLNHTAAAFDPIGYGSAANGANLALRDGAASSVNSIDYASFDTASGEYKPNSPASGLNSGSSTGLWSFLFSNESLNPNGQVDEVKLKYQEGKAVIRGAQGVEIVNVRFEGMDEVELEAASLGGRVLMSGTLVSDPTISKLAMRALSSAEKSVLTVAGLNPSMEAVAAEINHPNFTGKTDITIAGDRALQIAAINVAGQLALNSHTIVFNNANVTSAGVIDARTRDGMVNRTYGSVVPGTVNFMGANGNNFLNTANNASMSIANSANIVNALNGGQMRENGAGGATVMNVGRR